MQRLAVLALLAGLFSTVFLCASVSAESLIISDVNVVDVVEGKVIRDAAIVVIEDEITFVGPLADAAFPQGIRQIDGDGRWAIPGLWDMHVHVAMATRGAMPVLIANGVTHVRDMGGNWEDIRNIQNEIRLGTVVGPHVLTCGPILESVRWLTRAEEFLSEHELEGRIGVSDATTANDAIAGLAADGADFVKIRTVQNGETYAAISEAAQQHGLPFAGHAPPAAVSLVEASEMGQRSIEHYVSAPGIKRLPENLAPALEVFSENGTHFVPTLVSAYGFRIKPTEDVLAIIDDESDTLDPRRKYVPNEVLASWRQQMEMKQSERVRFDYVQIHQRNVELFREMHNAGVALMIGTDLGAPFVFPGFSFHDELAIMVDEVKLSSMDAIRAATIIPARFSGQDAMYGAIQVGRAADFLLVDRNPLENIRNLGDLFGVFHRGEWLDNAEIAQLLQRASMERAD